MSSDPTSGERGDGWSDWADKEYLRTLTPGMAVVGQVGVGKTSGMWPVVGGLREEAGDA